MHVRVLEHGDVQVKRAVTMLYTTFVFNSLHFFLLTTPSLSRPSDPWNRWIVVGKVYLALTKM